jgi:hypothetical protein
MVLELLTPVSGLNRLHAHARCVHFLGSGEDGSFHILALIQRVNKTSPQYVSYLHWYSLRTPPLQHRFGDKYLSACPDFLSAWLPQHSSFIKILGRDQKTGKIQTECPHGLRKGDLVRFRDSMNSLQNLPVCRVVDVDVKNSCLFEVEPKVSMVSGSFVQLQPRFFPFQKLEQKLRCLYSSTGTASNIKILLVRKLPNGGREAAWIRNSPNSEPFVYLYTWPVHDDPGLPENGISKIFRHDDPGLPDNGIPKIFHPPFSPREFSSPIFSHHCVECACFLPSSAMIAMIALGCRVQSGSTFTSELLIFEEARQAPTRHFTRVQVDGTLPTFTSLSLLPTDEANPSDSVSDVDINICPTVLLEFVVADLMSILRSLLFAVHIGCCD